jgi:putative transposase
MAQEPLRVACFRFEQISPFLDRRLSASERNRMLTAAARVEVVWPTGRVAPVPRSTLYRWLKIYRRDPRIEALMDRPREVRIKSPAIESAWMEYALALLEEEPERSLFIVGLRLQDHFRLKKPPPRSSLSRALKQQPRYRKLRQRAKGEKKLRRRFQARHPHEIWHADAKAAFTARFIDGRKLRLQILSILDDATRFILRALVVPSESMYAAVTVFKQAGERYGLPAKFYADRGSAYDSDLFRRGLAILGVHRINTRSRNPSAHGKIEAYHRSLQKWFIVELRHQPLRDLEHLQELLDAFIDRIYHQHRHRELRMSPGEAFGDRLSSRLVSLERLREAFLEKKWLIPHRKDGTIRVKDRLFVVPPRLLTGAKTRKVAILIDPENPGIPYVRLPQGGVEELQPAIKPAGGSRRDAPRPRGEEPIGSLTPLLEKYRGRTLPQARPGFGLPEIYAAFSCALARPVPFTETEAELILGWLKRSGPFDPESFQSALDSVLKRLGTGRPLARIVAELEKIVRQPQPEKETL